MEMLGEFWNVQQPNLRCSGVLEETAEGKLHLRLILPRGTDDRREHVIATGTIHGVTAQGRPVSLLDCFPDGSSSSADIQVEIVGAQYAIDGLHVGSMAEESLSRIYVEPPNLAPWFSGNRIEYQNGPGPAFSACYAGPIEISFAVGSGKLTARRWLGRKATFGRAGIQLEESYGWEFEPGRPVSISRVLEIVFKWNSFFAFACFRPREFGVVTVVSVSETEERVQRGTLLRGFSKKESPTESFYVNPLFRESDARNFPQIAAQWDARFEDLRVPVVLLLTSRKPDSFLSERLVHLTQAIETLHRRTAGGEYMDKASFRSDVLPQIVAAIPKSIPADFREAIARRLDHAYEFSLRRRMRLLVREHAETLRAFQIEPDRLAGNAVSERNGWTHHEWSEPQLDARQLYLTCESLDLLLTLSILTVVGIPQPQRHEWATRGTYYRFRITAA